MTLQEFKDRQKSAPGFVYIWTNNINGKKYIGSHKGKPDDGYVASGVAINRAINKYGIENFTRRILYRGKGYRRMETMFIIQANNALNSKEFYNLSHIAAGYCEHSEETRAKIKANMPDMSGENHPWFGRKHSEETKAKIKANMPDQSGENSPNFGKKHSEETRAKLSKARMGKKHSAESKAKIGAANKGRPSPSMSEETRAKISAKLACIPKSEEHKTKIGAANKGKTRGKGMRHWNNGTICKRSYECPGEGFVIGRLLKNRCI